jgi:hypothetical protein
LDDVASNICQALDDGKAPKAAAPKGDAGFKVSKKKVMWNSTQNVDAELLAAKAEAAATEARDRIIADRHNLFMSEMTLSRRNQVCKFHAVPHSATFAGKKQGDAVRFSLMMQQSQRARREVRPAHSPPHMCHSYVLQS